MLDDAAMRALRAQILERVRADRSVLDHLRAQVRPLRGDVRPIQPRATAAVSLVATDGGDNQVVFDPFMLEVIRVVDSSNNEHCLEAVSPTIPLDEVTRRQFGSDGAPKTALGRLMVFLGVRNLTSLSHMLHTDAGGQPRSASWVRTYRELIEWATLFDLVRERAWGNDTIFIFDGLLRTKLFARDLFPRLIRGFDEAIARHWRDSRRRLSIAGVAKGSKVLDRYRLAMVLEGTLAIPRPTYVRVPRELEEAVYVHAEYARGDDRVVPGGEINRFVGGAMFFVRFGPRPSDPIWPVDILQSQVGDAPVILGSMLADAQNGFPVPFYPQCLQRAHANAALTGFDYAVVQDQIVGSIRDVLGTEGSELDAFRMAARNPAAERYGG